MGIELLKPGHEDEWNEYVHTNSQATFYHQSAWKQAVEQTYGLQPFYLLARDNGKIVGILPLFLVKSPLFGNSLVSIAFATYGGVCADDDNTVSELINAAKEIAVRQAVRYLELRQFNKVDLPLPKIDQYATFLLELKEDPDELWESFKPKVRNQVRKAVKSGLEFRMGNEYLSEFYEVYAERMRDLGTPVHKLALFQQLINACPEQVALFIVRYQEKTIGGMFATCFKDTLNDIWACSANRYFQYNPNNLLYWNALKFSCERKLKFFDFGRSTQGSGTAKFKEQWGTQIWPLHYYQWMSKGQEVFDPKQPGLGQTIFTGVWQRLPVSLTKLIGPSIRRGVP